MNRIHRIVWSEHRRAHVVTHEGAASRGKPATRRTVIASALLALGGGLAFPALAACDLTGDGSEQTPYQVTSPADLAKVGTDCAPGASYLQTANITLTGSSNLPPIGTSVQPFTGTYDGGNHTITGLHQDASTLGTNRLGLFGTIQGSTSQTTEIRNLVVENATLSVSASATDLYAGGLVGYLASSTGRTTRVSNVTVKDTQVTASVVGVPIYVGGAIGFSTSPSGTLEITHTHVRNATVQGSVTGTGSGNGANRRLHVGALVGAVFGGNYSSVSSTGSVTAAHAGSDGGDAHVNVGGLAGYIQGGSITDAYSTASVALTSNLSFWGIGGLIGASHGGTVTRSYATGAVNGSQSVALCTAGRCGGVVGTSFGTFTDNFWDTTTTGRSTSWGTGSTGKTTAEMQTASTFSGAGWPTSAWVLQNGAYPTLQPPNALPVATQVSVTGTPAIGQPLSGSYTWSDADNGDTDTNTTYQWYRQDDTNGSNRVAINGASGTITANFGVIPDYSITSTDAGKYVLAAITPGDGKGSGSPVFSSPTLVPLPISITTNTATTATPGRTSASFSLTTDVAGTGCWAVLPAAGSAPAASDLCDGMVTLAGAVARNSTLPLDAGTATSFSVTGLTQGTAYALHIVAGKDGYLTSLQSVAFTTAATSEPVAPAAPTASPGDGQVSLSWNAPSDDGGSAVTGYRVQQSSDQGVSYGDAAGGCAPITTQNATTTTCNATGLTNGTAYQFRIAAINGIGAGTYSAASLPATPAASAPPPPPPVTLPSGGGSGVVSGGGQTIVIADNGATGSTINLAPSSSSGTSTNTIQLPGTGSLSVTSSGSSVLTVASLTTGQGSSPVLTVTSGTVTVTATAPNQPLASGNGVILVTANQSGASATLSGTTGTPPRVNTAGNTTITVLGTPDQVAGAQLELAGGGSGGAPVTFQASTAGAPVTLMPGNTGATMSLVNQGGSTGLAVAQGTVTVTATGTGSTGLVLGGLGGSSTTVNSLGGGSSFTVSSLAGSGGGLTGGGLGGGFGGGLGGSGLGGSGLGGGLGGSAGGGLGGGQGGGFVGGTGSGLRGTPEPTGQSVHVTSGTVSIGGRPSRQATISREMAHAPDGEILPGGILHSGETAVVDARGEVLAAYLGSDSGNRGIVGDAAPTPVLPGLAVAPARPHLAGRSVRLGADVESTILGGIQAAGYAVAGSADAFGAFDLVDGQRNVFRVAPAGRVRIDARRPDGIELQGNGTVAVTRNSVIVTYVPALADIAALASYVQTMGGQLAWSLNQDGSYTVNLPDGRTFGIQPGYAVQEAQGNERLTDDGQGHLAYVAPQGRKQTLFPTAIGYEALLAELRGIDAAATLSGTANGRLQLTLSGRSYTLQPDYQLNPVPLDRPGQLWWIGSDGRIHIRLNGVTSLSAQGYLVR